MLCCLCSRSPLSWLAFHLTFMYFFLEGPKPSTVVPAINASQTLTTIAAGLIIVLEAEITGKLTGNVVQVSPCLSICRAQGRVGQCGPIAGSAASQEDNKMDLLQTSYAKQARGRTPCSKWDCSTSQDPCHTHTHPK